VLRTKRLKEMTVHANRVVDVDDIRGRAGHRMIRSQDSRHARRADTKFTGNLNTNIREKPGYITVSGEW
jgi:hypothetical protein